VQLWGTTGNAEAAEGMPRVKAAAEEIAQGLKENCGKVCVLF